MFELYIRCPLNEIKPVDLYLIFNLNQKLIFEENQIYIYIGRKNEKMNLKDRM